MKSHVNRGMVYLYALILASFLLPGTVLGSFSFIQPELPLADDGHESVPQLAVHGAFDNGNQFHAVWVDGGFSPDGPYLMGTVVSADSHVLIPFRALHGDNANAFDYPFMVHSYYHTDRMYVFGQEHTGSAVKASLSYWNLNDLPAQPSVIDVSDVAIVPSSFVNRHDFDVVSHGVFITYAYVNYPNIHLRRFDQDGQIWDTSETIITPVSANDLQHPRLAVDDDNYLYLSYENHLSVPESWDQVIRRGQTANHIDDFDIEVTGIATSPAASITGDLVVTGPSTAPYVSLVYVNEMTMKEITCQTAIKSDWGTNSWSGGICSIATRDLTTSIIGPNAAYGADGKTLYTVWADNNLANDEIYGAVSSDGGFSFSSTERLTDVGAAIVDGPNICTGPINGSLAITYTRNTGSGTSPYVLFAMSSFFDNCNSDPTTYWDSSTGVTLDATTVTPLSPPYCYRFDGGRGQLLNDYGAVEHFGGVDLYFYDDTSITTEDFYVTLENTNARGVIRMLGVRNDTSSSSYRYSFDGITWVDTTIPRSTGWHHLVMATNEATGLNMYIDDPAQNITDPTFQYFTRITIQGGGSGGAFFVDDITVQATPLLEEQPLPSTSLLFLMILLGAITWLVIRRR